jgi:hypothetical protein
MMRTICSVRSDEEDEEGGGQQRSSGMVHAQYVTSYFPKNTLKH